MKTRLVLIVLLGLAYAIGARAQTPTPVRMEPGRTYILQFEHPGPAGEQFRLWMNGARVKDFAPGEVTKGAAVPNRAGYFFHTFAFTAPSTPGQYELGLSAFAFDSAGKEFDSARALMAVTPDRTSAPESPSNWIIKIQITVAITQNGGG